MIRDGLAYWFVFVVKPIAPSSIPRIPELAPTFKITELKRLKLDEFLLLKPYKRK